MTLYIIGHGAIVNLGELTHVSKEGRLSLYSEPKKPMSFALGLHLMMQGNDKADPWQVFSFGDADTLPNYTISALREREVYWVQQNYQLPFRMLMSGVSEELSTTKRLCECPEVCASQDTHSCDGVLGVVRDGDIRLIACLGFGALGSNMGMTTRLSEKSEINQQINANLTIEQTRAEAANKELRSGRSDSALAEMNLLESEDPSLYTRLLAASKPLAESVVIARAKRRFTEVSPLDFLSYYEMIDEDLRSCLVGTLQPSQQASQLDAFAASFPFCDQGEIFHRWGLLSERDRSILTTRSTAIAKWRAGPYQALAEMKVALDSTAATDWVKAFLKFSTMESGEYDYSANPFYDGLQQKIQEFFDSPSSPRLKVWNQLAAEDQSFIQPLIGGPSFWQ
ncbi:hypothetical protein ACGFX8_37265 [Streptomyces sp. NPDC048362]|uniref:hypothetical protein n=1 Tax=Streptomyces sp. NPDC048362 TaxID=3365539 RepID=UPI00370FD0D9